MANTGINVTEEYLRVYIDNARRCRWLLLTTISITAMMLAYLYVEQFSYHTELLQASVGDFLGVDSAIARLERDLLAEDGESQSRRRKIAQYSQFVVARSILRNELNKVEYGRQSLPVLGVNVPGPDFVPLLVSMVGVFYGAVWLSYRSLRATTAHLLDTIRDASDERGVKGLLRQHFTFTGALERSSPFLARVVLWGAVLAPVFTILLAIVLDLKPLFEVFAGAKLIVPLSAALVLRILLMLVTLGAMARMAAAVLRTVWYLDRETEIAGLTHR